MSVILEQANVEYLYTDTLPVSAPPFLFVGWGKITDIDDWHTIVGLSDTAASTDYWSMDFGGGTTGDPVRGVARAGGTQREALTTTGYSADTWTHAAYYVKSTTDRRAYIGGTDKGTNTTSVTPSSIDRFAVGVRPLSNPTDGFPLDGRIAHVAVYDTTGLSDATVETAITSLAAGRNPQNIEVGSLIAHWELDTDPNDDFGSNTLTEVGTITYDGADNPTVDNLGSPLAALIAAGAFG